MAHPGWKDARTWDSWLGPGVWQEPGGALLGDATLKCPQVIPLVTPSAACSGLPSLEGAARSSELEVRKGLSCC